ncbi:hypothetical protein LCGC14_0660150 [marine sediment metagenome]|uniref:Uncharacterized protein n=1 Tax=marine sediment metagenome TaxID=412755 RepID=A0A0F9RDR6_9ZZZZ
MLSKTIRNAAISGKYNEFDLETWRHEAKALEEDLGLAEYRQEEQLKRAAKYYAENVELREYVGHKPTCVQYTGPYDLGELEPACECGLDRVLA